MPSDIHQGLLTLFRNHPELGFELARAAGARMSSAHDRFEEASGEFEDPGRRGVTVHADLVLLGFVADRCEALVVEIQRSPNLRKLISLPIYAIGPRSRHGCPCWVLFVSPEPAVRRWARHELFAREPHLVPLILEPEMITPITTVEAARDAIGWAVLATVFHADGPRGVACARATLQALLELDWDNRDSYISLVVACLSEKQMNEVSQYLPATPEVDELWERERRSRPFRRGHREGFVEGRAEGRAEGVEIGSTEGLAQMRRTIVTLLAARDLSLDEDGHRRLQACEDLEALGRLTVRAALIEDAAELFD